MGLRSLQAIQEKSAIYLLNLNRQNFLEAGKSVLVKASFKIAYSLLFNVYLRLSVMKTSNYIHCILRKLQPGTVIAALVNEFLRRA